MVILGSVGGAMARARTANHQHMILDALLRRRSITTFLAISGPYKTLQSRVTSALPNNAGTRETNFGRLNRGRDSSDDSKVVGWVTDVPVWQRENGQAGAGNQRRRTELAWKKSEQNTQRGSEKQKDEATRDIDEERKWDSWGRTSYSYSHRSPTERPTFVRKRAKNLKTQS